jgi:hypothetical protein
MMEGLSDDTTTAEVTQKNGPGATIDGFREASREVRVQVWLTASNMHAMEFGTTWLKSMLKRGACGAHGSACGTTDFAFFSDAPPQKDVLEDPEVYLASVEKYRRYLHDVARVSGPFTVDEVIRPDVNYVGRLVEFTLVAEVPWVFGVTREIVVPPTIPRVIQDVVYNLAPYPSAELPEGSVTVSTNEHTNPSLEVTATGWSGAATSVSGSSPASYFTSGRVLGELSAVGSASFRGRILGNGSTAASGVANIAISSDVLFTQSALARRSITVWAAALNLGGTTGASINSITVTAEWRNSTTLLRTDTIGTGTPAEAVGKAYSMKSILPPVGADRVRVVVTVNANWSSNSAGASNSDIRLYADTMAVTVP